MTLALLITAVTGAWAQAPTIYFQQDYSTETVDWTTGTGGRYTPIIENGYLTVNQDQRSNNGATLTCTATQGKVDAGKDFTMTFNVKLGASDNQDATEFNIYGSNSGYILTLAEGSAGATAWTINGGTQTATVSAGGGKSLDELSWIFIQVTSIAGGKTYLTLKDEQNNIIDGFDKTEIPTISVEGGLGKMRFVTSRRLANFAIDNVLVRDVVNDDLPQEEIASDVDVTTNAAEGETTFTEASFNMPAFDATAEYELVRDMTVDVDATIAERIRIKKENNVYVVVTDGQLTPAVSDKISGTAVAMTATTDYTAKLQKKTEGDTPTWADATTLSVGTFRYVITGTGLYDGNITTNEFQLFEGYEVTIPAGEYATYFKDEALYVENENAQLYTISSVTESEAVLSDAITVAPANTPLLVYNKSQTETLTFLLIPTTDNTPDNVTAATQFVGTLEATTIPASATGADNYALNGYAFVWVKNAIEVGANKCWLHIASQPAAARAMTRSIVGGNGTTGIDAIENVTIDNEGWYDLQGRKLQAKPNRSGIYIHNGKKVVVRK
jgi:hypothetical protein